jgi:hypothetical protein
MDRIHYAGDSILTGTEIAHALLDYARALAQVGSSDTVVIPTITADGQSGRSEILVGPASQLISDSDDSELDEVVDEDLVTDLRARADHVRRYGTSAPATEAHPVEPTGGWSEFDDI